MYISNFNILVVSILQKNIDTEVNKECLRKSKHRA